MALNADVAGEKVKREVTQLESSESNHGWINDEQRTKQNDPKLFHTHVKSAANDLHLLAIFSNAMALSSLTPSPYYARTLRVNNTTC